MTSAKSPFIHIDPRKRQGLQDQIYGAIRAAILGGTLAPGAQLLSSRALASDLGVSRTTTILAYEQLTAEGYLMPRQGAGTFVVTELPDDLPHAGVHARRSPARHPALSARGSQLALLPPAASRLGGPPRAFRIGVPALDHFPHRVWSQLVNRRLRQTTMTQLDYGDASGHISLRQAIASHVSEARGTVCTPDQIFVVAGAQRGLEIACQALLDPGDHAAVEDPGYPGAWSALAGAGALRRTVRVDAEGLDVEALSKLSPAPRLVYVTPSHQFPLGVPMSLPRRLALLRWADDADAWIVEDDYDSEYRYGTRPTPCLHGLANDGRVVYLGSFSKTLCPAIRLGFLIVPADVRVLLVAIRRAADVHPPVFEQLVVADLIAEGHYDRHLRRMRAICRERLEALQDAVGHECAATLRLRPVQTGLHAVADVCGDVDLQQVLREASTRDLEVMPLSAYSAGRGACPDALVLGFGAVDPASIRAGVKQLARALEVSARKRRGARPRRRTPR